VKNTVQDNQWHASGRYARTKIVLKLFYSVKIKLTVNSPRLFAPLMNADRKINGAAAILMQIGP
jgi:hypothetical protein